MNRCVLCGRSRAVIRTELGYMCAQCWLMKERLAGVTKEAKRGDRRDGRADAR